MREWSPLHDRRTTQKSGKKTALDLWPRAERATLSSPINSQLHRYFRDDALIARNRGLEGDRGGGGLEGGGPAGQEEEIAGVEAAAVG